MNTVMGQDNIGEKLYDLAMINRFCRGDKNLTKKMIQVFLTDIPSSVEEIKTAYQEKDFMTLKKTAHRIKPVLSMYSIAKVGNEIEVLSNMDQDEIMSMETSEKITKLESVIGMVTQQLNMYLL